MSGPLTVSERTPVLDVLRGAALFGVLLVNMEFHRGPALYTRAAGLRVEEGPADRAASVLIALLGQGKAYTVLAFLFGYGAVVQLSRGPVGRYRRRLAALFVLGAAHAVLLFFGDVLALYAVAGLVLLAFRGRADRTLLGWGIGLLVVPAVLIALLLAGGPALSAADPALQARAAEAVAAYGRGGPADAVAQRLRDLGSIAPSTVVGLPAVLAPMLVGAWAARRRLLVDVGAHRAGWRRAAAVGLAAGLPLNVVLALSWVGGAAADPVLDALALLAGLLAPAVLAVGYVGAVVLLVERARRDGALVGALAAVGRLSLTNYVAQSLIAALVFTGYGLGLYGSTGALAGLALTLAVFAAQAVASVVYLRRRALGPLEWALRLATYARRPSPAGP